MLTFADLIFILMYFFKIQISFSNHNKKKFDNVVQGMVQTPQFHDKKMDSLKNLAKNLNHEIYKNKLQRSARFKLDADDLAV